MNINHIGKNADGKLISNAIEYDFQPRLCCTLNRILPWLGLLVVAAAAITLWYIGAHPAL
jgi:hypothetical protein